jgi:hypothetical protein
VTSARGRRIGALAGVAVRLIGRNGAALRLDPAELDYDYVDAKPGALGSPAELLPAHSRVARVRARVPVKG